LVALLSHRDANSSWAATQSQRFPPPWITCEAVLSEAFHLVNPQGGPALAALLQRRAVVFAFNLNQELARTLKLIEKYSDTPMSLADACLVRMTETLDDPLLLTTDTDFRIYRRHSRQAVPCIIPS
jgi:predicted nucleic acid-binding protein